MIIREESNKTKVVLFPGEFYVADSDTAMMALVGSCACVCLYDPVNGIAGMGQFMLPIDEELPNNTPHVGGPWDYGANAMKEFVHNMTACGADKRFLRAGICGGTSFHIPSIYDEHFDQVGPGTSHFFREYMRKEGINIIGSDMGGNTGRIVRFETRDYFLNIRKIKDISLAGLAYRDREYWKAELKNYRAERLALPDMKRTA
ncbi:MAG: chemotaxis protein CheD [Syntrophorhabdaceae bacterium]